MTYQEFLEAKSHSANEYGFSPKFMPSALFDFQQHLVDISDTFNTLFD